MILSMVVSPNPTREILYRAMVIRSKGDRKNRGGGPSNRLEHTLEHIIGAQIFLWSTFRYISIPVVQKNIGV